MKKILYLVLILLIMIMGLLGCSKRIEVNSNKTSTDIQQMGELNRSIENLINKSLAIQYGTSKIQLSQIFSSTFISKIQANSDFYKKDLQPYKIVSLNLDVLKDESADNFVVNVRVSDSKGEYDQVIHIAKKDGMLIIEEIEYDI